VFEAFDPVLNRTVALKFLNPENSLWTDKFLRGGEAQARVNHEHVCPVYQSGMLEGKPYIAMQYVDGSTLGEASNQMTLEEKVRLMMQVAEAVDEAHRIGLVHRDLKPANILVQRTEGGEWKPYVTDFGLARELGRPGPTIIGTIAGTPSYMAPEQARGEVDRLDSRSDVYALGATLYDLLAGRPPFDGDTVIDVIIKVIDKEPPRLRRLDRSIPSDLEVIVSKCMQKQPELRYSSAKAFSQDLQRFLEHEPLEAKRPSRARRLTRNLIRRFCRR